MKSVYIFFLLSLFIANEALAQSCFPDGIKFTAQHQIDNFQTTYPDCTEIEGDLIIERSLYSTAITNLNGLNVITAVGGDLKIYSLVSNYPFLSSFEGLDNLVSIGGSLYLRHCDVVNLSGLDMLDSIGGGLYIIYNYKLESLTALENLTALKGDITMYGNSSLSDCSIESICDYLINPDGVINIYNNAAGCDNPPEIATACGINLTCLPNGNYYFLAQQQVDSFAVDYQNCTEIYGAVTINGADIVDLLGLNPVTAIHGNLLIGNDDFGSPLLIRLNGLENLTTLDGHLQIMSNGTLVSLTGIENIGAGSITNLSIHNNPVLQSCEVTSVCNYLADPNGEIYIQGNAPGCNNPIEVEDACLIGIGEIRSEGRVSIYPNPAQKELSISPANGTLINEIRIYDQLGQIALRSSSSNNTIDISNLRKGIYVVVIHAGQYIQKQKLIIR